jgi:hypothetical protein
VHATQYEGSRVQKQRIQADQRDNQEESLKSDSVYLEHRRHFACELSTVLYPSFSTTREPASVTYRGQQMAVFLRVELVVPAVADLEVAALNAAAFVGALYGGMAGPKVALRAHQARAT